jgi:hypothetical protein
MWRRTSSVQPFKMTRFQTSNSNHKSAYLVEP